MTELDLFHEMLNQARKRCSDIQWIQGDNTNPPFANNSFDYITNQFSYHHVQDKNRMIMSIFRLLRSKGRFVITNLDPWSMPGWIVYQFFPPSRQRDLSGFLPVGKLTDLMQKIGFCNVQLTLWKTNRIHMDTDHTIEHAFHVQTPIWTRRHLSARGFEARRDRRLRQLCAVHIVVSFSPLRYTDTLQPE